jgi:rSAM/selenodomain-associated transferase 1
MNHLNAARGAARVGVCERASMKNDEKQTKARALVVVAKAPLEGFVKTRLSPHLGPADAATLYECLLGDIVAKLEKYEDSEFWLAFAPGGEEYFFRNYPAIRLLPQRGKDLGKRLHHVFVDLFHRGYSEIVVADSDSPTVLLSSIDQAYRLLSKEGCELVLGPSDDGGYYLIGLKDATERIFHDIPWSTKSVLETTLKRAGELALKVGLLPPAYDIDVEEDLRRLWNDFMTFEHLQELAPRTYLYLRNLTDNRFLPVHALISNSEVKETHDGRKR